MNSSMGLIGRKLGMTQLFQDDGTVVLCTVVELGPNTITQVKTEEGNDGYNAVQLSFGTKKEHRATRPELGHAKAANTAPGTFVSEIRVTKEAAAGFTRGQTVNIVDVFAVGNLVDVVGTSKGKGFAGVMKKYHFAGFERSHGNHEYFRHGGSIGTRLTPGMTLAGKKMPGQMGNKRVTVQNIEVVRLDTERNLLFIRGGVPGPVGAYVTVRKAVKNA